MKRHFDVELSDAARSDLGPLTQSHAKDAVDTLAALSDTDLHDLVGLASWTRGPIGSWVFLKRGAWCYLCQWDSGTPAAWHLGLGRGRLLVEGIKTVDYAETLMRRKP